MNRWKYIVGSLLAILIVSFFSQPAQASFQTPEGCIRLKTGLRCISPYCVSSTPDCNADGSRCTCIVDDETKCRVPTGSLVRFTKENPDDLYAKDIRVSGGIWQLFIDMAKKQGINTDISDNNEIIFNLDNKFGSNKARYKTRIFKELRNKSKNQKFKEFYLGMEVKFKEESDTAFILNQYYEFQGIVSTSNKTRSSVVSGFASPDRCGPGLYDKKTASDQPFFYKKSTIELTKLTDITCYAAPQSMTQLTLAPDYKIFNNSQNYITKQALKAFVNCPPSGMFASSTTTDYEKAQWLKKILDKSLINTSQPKEIKLIKDPNGRMTIFGYAFPAGEDSTKRQQKIDKINQKCTDKCDLNNKLTALGIDQSSNKSNAILEDFLLPDNCKYCKNQELLQKLQDNPNQSLEAVLANQLIESDVSQPQCGTIDSGYIELNSSKISSYSSGTMTNPNYEEENDEEDNSATLQSEIITEDELNTDLPNKLIAICENHATSEQDRMNCKYNALTCVEKDLSVTNSNQDVCRSIDPSLKTAKWLICPVALTGSKAANEANGRGEASANNILSLNQNLLKEANTKKIWQRFVNIANSLTIIAFILVILSHITGIGFSNYQIKKMLPKIIIAVILTNISYYLIQLSVELSNIIGYSISDLFPIPRPKIGNKLLVLAIGAAGTALVMALIGMLLPAILTIGIGIAAALFIFGFRDIIIVTSVIVTPLAIMISIFPKGNKLLGNWLKILFGILLIYPTTSLLVGVGQYLSSKSDSLDGMAKIVAWVAPFAAILFVPKVILTVIKSMPLIGAGITKGFKNLTGTSLKKSWGGASTKEDIATLRKKGRLAVDRRLGGVYGSKTFNKLTGDYGSRRRSFVQSEDWRSRKRYSDIIGDDMQLQQALIRDNGKRGAGYNSLNKEQQQKYQLIEGMGGVKDKNFWLSNMETMARNGVHDKSAYDDSEAKARATGASEKEIQQAEGTVNFIAKQKGDVELQAVLETNNQKFAYKPPAEVADAINNINNDPTIAAALIYAYGKKTDIQYAAKKAGLTLSQKQITAINKIKQKKYRPSLLLSAASLVAAENQDFQLAKLGLDRLRTKKDGIDLMAGTYNMIKEEYDLLDELEELTNLTDKEKEAIADTKKNNNKAGFTATTESSVQAFNDNLEKKINEKLNNTNFRDIDPRLFGSQIDPVTKQPITGTRTKTLEIIIKKIKQPLTDENVNRHYLKQIASDWDRSQIQKKTALAPAIIDAATKKLGTRPTSAEDALIKLGYDLGGVEY